jgi:hypothetical protein
VKRFLLLNTVGVIGLLSLFGCGSQPPPANMAPPVNNAPPMASAPMGAPMGQNVWQWQDVPQGQQIPVTRAVFDQAGYQIFANTGETIVVPFANNNLYVMRFGRTGGQPYFVNEGDAPVLYVRPDFALENASAQGARWYPLPDNYAYSRPVYVSFAPSWSDYMGMSWYPGMAYYGGMYGYHPYSLAWMPGFYINIGGTRYNNYASYHTYYTRNPGYRTSVVYHNYSAPRSTGSFGSGRSSGSTGSFGNGRRSSGFGGSAGSTGSFGSGRTSSGFGGAGGSSGSFGNGRSNASGSAFGSSRPSGSSSSFGGSGRTSGSYNSAPRASSGSFGGGGRSSGSSFGGGRSSFGGGRRR